MTDFRFLRLGLCCLFKEQDITFKSRKATYISRFSRQEQLALLSTTILHNGSSLLQALHYCHDHQIGSFRITSQFAPLKTHPDLRYDLEQLPDYELILELFGASKDFAYEKNIRLIFHPDQFTLLSSPKKKVTQRSISELEYHAEMADLLGVDVIIIHGGGGYGDKRKALARLETEIAALPMEVSLRLVLENDDRVYTPVDLLPLCERTATPLVYDVHHHRCLNDGLSEHEATVEALKTWQREPVFHISSPREGWQGKNIRAHHDYIDFHDIPECWNELHLIVEVEAKAKEVAIGRLQQDITRNSPSYQKLVG